MSWNTKWTTVTFLAASLGAAAFACTVTSGTVDDVGGTAKDGGSSTNDGSISESDAGGDASAASCASGRKDGVSLGTAACESCMAQNCCTEQQTCFQMQPDGGSVDCSDYAICVQRCIQNPIDGGADAGACGCIEGECIGAEETGGSCQVTYSITPKTVVDAYEQIVNCGESKGCKTACGL